MPFDFQKIFVEGIRSIAAKDIIYAGELGYRIKHVGILRNDGGRIEARVHPALIPKEQLLANVLFEQNAVSVIGDASGSMLFSGPGAGSLPTASAFLQICWILVRFTGFGKEKLALRPLS